jgi:hypothetical protein
MRIGAARTAGSNLRSVGCVGVVFWPLSSTPGMDAQETLPALHLACGCGAVGRNVSAAMVLMLRCPDAHLWCSNETFEARYAINVSICGYGMITILYV